MELVIDDAFLPATLTAPPMTDEEFAAFCAEHPDLFFEVTAEGELIVMPPTYSDTGAQNFDVAGQLRDWAVKNRRGVGCRFRAPEWRPAVARRFLDAKEPRQTTRPSQPVGILASLP